VKEAEVYHEIFNYCVHEGLSPGEIARRLNEGGQVTRAGHPYESTHVRHLLTSPAAYGDWNRHRVVLRTAANPLRQRNFEKSTYGLRMYRPKDEWIRVSVPPIVTRDLWEQAQSMIAVHRKPTPPKPSALCIGLIFCGECGSRVGIHRDRRTGRHRRYICLARRLRRDSRYPRYREISCDLPTFRQKDVDQVVWDKIEELVSDPGRLWELAYGSEAVGERDSMKQRVSDLRRKLIQTRVQEERAARLYTLGAAATTSEKQIKEAVARRRALETELAQAERALNLASRQEGAKEQVFKTLRSLQGDIDNLSLEQRRNVLRFLVPGGLTDRIELHGDGAVNIRGILNFDLMTPSDKRVPYFDSCYFR
jgi:hypothetical protein